MPVDPFASFIGHETARDVLRRAVQSGRLPHALLIVGPSMVGRRTLAEALIRSFLSAEGPLDLHPDFVRLERETDAKTGKEKSAIGIEQVRDLRERLGLSSFSGRKAALVEEADRLPAGSANALLKTLEEPRGDTLIILRAARVDAVPATIASRCQVIRLHPVARGPLADALVARGLDRAEAQVLAALSLGAPGRALRLLRDSAERAEADVGLAGFLAAVSGPLPERLRAAAALLPKEEANKAAVLDRTLDAWERAARDLLLQAIGCAELQVQDDARLTALSGRLPPSRLIPFLHAAAQVRRDAAHHVNPQLALEHVLLAA